MDMQDILTLKYYCPEAQDIIRIDGKDVVKNGELSRLYLHAMKCTHCIELRSLASKNPNHLLVWKYIKKMSSEIQKVNLRYFELWQKLEETYSTYREHAPYTPGDRERAYSQMVSEWLAEIEGVCFFHVSALSNTQDEQTKPAPSLQSIPELAKKDKVIQDLKSEISILSLIVRNHRKKLDSLKLKLDAGDTLVCDLQNSIQQRDEEISKLKEANDILKDHFVKIRSMLLLETKDLT